MKSSLMSILLPWHREHTAINIYRLMVYEDMTVSQTHFAYNNHNLGSNEKYKYSNWSLIFGTISSVFVAIQHAHVLPPRWDKGAFSQLSASIVGMIFFFHIFCGFSRIQTLPCCWRCRHWNMAIRLTVIMETSAAVLGFPQDVHGVSLHV